MSFTEDSSYFGHWDPTFPFIYSLIHFPQKDLFLSVPSSTAGNRERFPNTWNLFTTD